LAARVKLIAFPDDGLEDGDRHVVPVGRGSDWRPVYDTPDARRTGRLVPALLFRGTLRGRVGAAPDSSGLLRWLPQNVRPVPTGFSCARANFCPDLQLENPSLISNAGVREHAGDRCASDCGTKPGLHIFPPDGVEFEGHHRVLNPVKVVTASAWRLQKIVGCFDEPYCFVCDQLRGSREFM